jgi:hypothetical protein
MVKTRIHSRVVFTFRADADGQGSADVYLADWGWYYSVTNPTPAST